MAVTAQGYVGQLLALLPHGRAWPREPGTALRALLDGLAEEYARIDRRGEELLTETDPRSATELLPDWERLLGLPDECSAIGATLRARRRAAHHKLTGVAGLDEAAIVQAAAELGYTITITQLNQAMADAVQGIDTTGGRWRFVWWVNFDAPVEYFNTLSGVDEPLATYGRSAELECRIRAIAPAHTYPVFVPTT